MKIAVLGAGVMGKGWITQFALFGHEVVCFDEFPKTLAGVPEFCVRLARKTAKRSKDIDPALAETVLDRIRCAKDAVEFLAEAKSSDVFFEVIFEDMDLKRRVLSDIVPKLPESVYFWSNTSSLDIEALAVAAGRPAKSLVVHGMNPVPMMAGVELVAAEGTTSDTVEHARRAMLEMGKAPFMAPNIPGFWVNRLLIPMAIDAMRLLEQGKVTVADGDIGMNSCLGHPQGIFKLCDFVSAPTMLRVSLEMFQATQDPRVYPPLLLARLVKEGSFGAATGKGFYDWTDRKNPKARDFSNWVIGTAEDITAQLR